MVEAEAAAILAATAAEDCDGRTVTVSIGLSPACSFPIAPSPCSLRFLFSGLKKSGVLQEGFDVDGVVGLYDLSRRPMVPLNATLDFIFDLFPLIPPESFFFGIMSRIPGIGA
jgi:hypothetical protein